MKPVTVSTESTEKITSYPPPRIVRPRNPKATWRPVIAICGDQVRTENDTPAASLPALLRQHVPAIIVCQDFGGHFRQICDAFQDDETFTYRVSPITRFHRDNPRHPVLTDAICHYFGWRTLKSNGKTRDTHFHYPLDPIWFLSAGIDDIDDNPDRPRLEKLFEWGAQLRDWTVEQELRLTASSGGIAAQLLKDPRFYPEPRRKCPKVINRLAREHLPGNHYELRTTPGIPKNAIMLDMENAHHALARRIRFPDANDLHAYGSLPNDETGKPPWTREDIPLTRPGIFCLQVSIPHIPREQFPPPSLREYGTRRLVCYSNELDWLKSFGVQVEGIWWAITSQQTEPGLNKYAEFAIQQIRTHSNYRNWLKPTLHSAYGLLAAKPRAFETGFRGEGWDYPMGSFCVPVRRVKLSHNSDATIVNVIHRGMVEAEVRKEALWYARMLSEVDRHRVLAIYADAVIVEDTGNPIRLLDYPWRVKETIRSMRFLNATQFTSPSSSRLPGVPRNARERYLHHRALSGALAESRKTRESKANLSALPAKIGPS